MYWKTLEGGMTQEHFSDFMIEMSELLQITNQQYIVFCDNTPAHAEEPIMGSQEEIIKLPKYLTFLNDCEMARSCGRWPSKENFQNLLSNAKSTKRI